MCDRVMSAVFVAETREERIAMFEARIEIPEEHFLQTLRSFKPRNRRAYLYPAHEGVSWKLR
jgi:hypothetical protein